MTTTLTIAQRVADLKEYINTGRIIEAMDEFYAGEVSMRENSNPPVVGLAANIEREHEFLAAVKEWKWTRWTATAINEDEGTSLLEYSFHFINTDDQPVTYEQATVQRWAGGKIVSERFYHG